MEILRRCIWAYYRGKYGDITEVNIEILLR